MSWKRCRFGYEGKALYSCGPKFPCLDCESVTETYVKEDDMDDRTNLDAFLERTRVAVQNRRSRKVKKGGR